MATTKPLPMLEEDHGYECFIPADVVFVLGNRLAKSEPCTPEAEALDQMVRDLFRAKASPIHYARLNALNMLVGAQECGCDDCVPMAREYAFFLEMSQGCAARHPFC